MQPFRIICETCRSRLKIRSADVIGEIHACPKCGSMVQIVPPAGWDPPAGVSPVDQSIVAGESALSISATASMFIPAGAMNNLDDVSAALEGPPAASPTTTAAAPASMPAGSSSPIMWWVGGGAASLFVLAGLVWTVSPHGEKPAASAPIAVATNTEPLAVKQRSDPKPATTAEQPALKPSETDVVSNSKDAATQPVELPTAQPAAKPAPVEPTPIADKASDLLVSVAAPMESNAKSAPAIDEPKTSIVEAKPTNAAAAMPSKAVEKVASAPDHSPVLKFDPLDFDPDHLSTKATPGSTTSTSSVPDKLPAESAVSGVAHNEAEPDTEGADPERGPAAGGGKVVPPPIANNGIAVRRGPPGDAPPKTPAEMLAAPVKSFQVSDMPLVRFVETVSGVAGTAVTLDPIALEQVGISPQATVSVNVQDASLQAILHDGLAQRRLDIAEQGGQLRVVLPKAHEAHTIDYDVKDLAMGTDATAVGRLIEHFVAPSTWNTAGGKGTLQVDGTTLHIEQSDAVRREVVIFCERLRTARSLAVKSKYPAAMLSVESPYHRLSAKLGEHTMFTFLPWTRLDDVLRGWQEMSGLMVLADWGALAEAELGPASPVACSAIDRPWQESLDCVLEPLGLGWWAVDGEKIQITSLAALEKIQRIEFYQVPAKLRSSFASNQALVDALERELVETTGKQASPVHMDIDEPSGRLIVLATPTAQRHLSQRLAGTK